jgi:hypothetical protein
MVAIERTAYPRMKRPPKAKELAELYTPTRKERDQAAATRRGEQSILSFLVLYKVFPARTSSPGQEGNRHLVPGQDTRLAPSG